jgi:hypothetical protein
VPASALVMAAAPGTGPSAPPGTGTSARCEMGDCASAPVTGAPGGGAEEGTGGVAGTRTQGAEVIVAEGTGGVAGTRTQGVAGTRTQGAEVIVADVDSDDVQARLSASSCVTRRGFLVKQGHIVGTWRRTSQLLSGTFEPPPLQQVY